MNDELNKKFKAEHVRYGTYCDFCATVIHPNDGTHVIIPHKGQPKGFDFHNTREIPCLSKELDLLRDQFAAPSN